MAEKGADQAPQSAEFASTKIHRAPVRNDHLVQALEDSVHHRFDRLGAELSGHGGGPGHVSEEHRDRTDLLGGGIGGLGLAPVEARATIGADGRFWPPVTPKA